MADAAMAWQRGSPATCNGAGGARCDAARHPVRPTPSCPQLLLPHANTSPPCVSASVCACPHATDAKCAAHGSSPPPPRPSPSPTPPLPPPPPLPTCNLIAGSSPGSQPLPSRPSCPWLLSPQVHRDPPAVAAALCHRPPDSAATRTPCSAGSATGDITTPPLSLLPLPPGDTPTWPCWLAPQPNTPPPTSATRVWLAPHATSSTGAGIATRHTATHDAPQRNSSCGQPTCAALAPGTACLLHGAAYQATWNCVQC
eukprot:366412-Chlamydomonas_euryale.AAC.18